MQYRRCPLITRCGGSFSREKPEGDNSEFYAQLY